MLELVCDNRRGDRLEIVVPTLNEERRIGNLLNCYGSDFDLVLLDDGSTDSTVCMAEAAGATVFHRTTKAAGVEGHFVHYANNLSRSGMCFWLIADEYVRRDDLVAVQAALKSGASIINCRRVNWVFGRRVRTYSSVGPRGACPGALRHRGGSIHNSLEVVPLEGKKVWLTVYDVHHLHLCSARTYFGTAGGYVFEEVEQFRSGPHRLRRFLRRYLGDLVIFLFWKSWRERDLSTSARLVLTGERTAILVLATMAWIEQRYLPSVEEQLAEYARFYLQEAQPESVVAVAAGAESR